MNDDSDWKVPVYLPDAAIEQDEILLSELESWISASKITVENGSDHYFRLLESKYPIGFNRIDWESGMNNILTHPIFSTYENRAYHEDECKTALENSISTLLGWLRNNAIHMEDHVIVLGDISNVALHMSIQTLFDCRQIIFLSHQNIYIFPFDAEWCMSYTHDHLFLFGKASDAKYTGCQDEDDGEDAEEDDE